MLGMVDDVECVDFVDQIDLAYEIYVLRIGHRPERDKRVTTHVALVARAFGCRGFILGDVDDSSVRESIEKVIDRWGGSYFRVESGVDSVKFITGWRRLYRDLCVVHLTMYGVHINSVMGIIKKRCRKILVIVGAEKVPREIYDLADYNIAVGSQPHSEVSALAVFLDRLFSGRELCLSFNDAKSTLFPHPRGKNVVNIDRE